MADLKNTNIDDTGFIKLPQGSSAQRPSGSDGLLRYNSDTDKLETYAGAASTWVAAGNDGALGTGGDSVFDISDEGSTYRVHTFTNNGTFTCTRAGEVEYLIIAGGGGGSGNYYDDGGGGGAGGLIQGTTTLSATGYSIGIGNGGAKNANGSNTTALGLTALGGGRGGGHRGSGSAGGSGGGGTGYYGNGIPGRPYIGGGRDSGDTGQPSSGGKGIVILRYPLRPDHPGDVAQAETVDPLIDFDFSRLSTYTGIGDVEDSRKNGISASRVNSSPLYGPGSIQGSLTFNGSSQYLQVTNFHNRPTTQITLEGWVWPNKSVTTGTRRGAFWSNASSTYLGIFNSNDGGANHGLHWALQTSGGRTGGNSGSIPNQQWSHLVGTYDGSRTKGYVNGVLVYDVAQTGTVSDGTWYCGVYANGINDGTHNWNGEMSQLRMYRRALTSDEVADNYNANRWRFGI